MSTNSFSVVPEFYDELMKPVPYRMWTSYYLLLLSRVGSKPRRVLDVACGTGTMCQMLYAEGLHMTGIDLSPGMIEQAKAKAAKKNLPVDYEVADARTFNLGRTFDGALSFFDSLNNILEPEGIQQAFHRVYEHLVPGGSWIFDLNTAYAFEQELFDQKQLGEKHRLQYKWKGEYDANQKIIEIRMKFWRDGQELEEVHRQRAYEEFEVREMLHRAGFVGIDVFHSYTLDPPRRKSDRIHFVALRPD
ncbi:MAG: methyltransferase domain-containing protein [Armatimonadetes bacterium]|nr:methyltransferase domain-containing protein [Armatimonadota bacterium]